MIKKLCHLSTHPERISDNDLVEVGVENFKSMESFKYDKKLAPKIGSKPFFAFIGEEFETVDELKHLKEMLLDIFRGEVRMLFGQWQDHYLWYQYV